MGAHSGRSVPRLPKRAASGQIPELAAGHAGTGPLEAASSRLASDPEAVEAMLSRLATRMRQGGFQWPVTGDDAWTTDDNDAIPAGYTYLAQLVAHDFVENSVQLPLISAYPGKLQRDYRAQRLVLDTIYGGGPVREPMSYATGTGTNERCLFRLGHVRGPEQPPFEPPKPPLVKQPPRDLPRASCPFLSDRPKAGVTPDALVADPRNDQHLIISQLTALFLELHNIVFAIVRSLQDTPTGDLATRLNFPRREHYVSDADFEHAQAEMAFLQTRKATAAVYRRVIVQDLLKRLLEPGVWAYYTDPARRFPADLLDPVHDNHVPAVFSHSVFRFGHVMARFSYQLNDQLVNNPSIKDVLDRSSARRSDLVPIAHNWIVDWSHFFDMGDGKPVNASRRLAPYIAYGPLSFDAIVPPEKDRDGGLFYRDFVRGEEAQVYSVATAVSKLRASERDRSDLLKDANFREHEVGRWLTAATDVGFQADELVELSKNPPLLLFVLFEAAHDQGGRRLGILGSTIVADVFFSALAQTEDVIERDPAVPVILQHVFAGQVPSTMPEVIRFMKAKGGLADVVYDPAAPDA
jgi:Animal haem peroxidase